MKKKKYTKAKIILVFGIFNLLISLLVVEDNFELFLFFFIIFSVCFVYSRKFILDLLGRPIIREICKLYNKKIELQKNIYMLEVKYKEVLDNILNRQKDINEINKYKNIINELILKEKELNINLIKLKEKKENIEQIIKQEQVVNRAIEREEKAFDLLSEGNIKLENEKEKLTEEINSMKKKLTPIKNQIEFINKYNINDIDNFDGIEFESFCKNLLIAEGYEDVEQTQESVDYGIDIIAEKDNIKYAIQCKRYEGKVGNDAIQEAMTGKEYYNCNIAIVFTNSTFTHNAQVLSRSAGVILWDRTVLLKMIERNKKRLL